MNRLQVAAPILAALAAAQPVAPSQAGRTWDEAQKEHRKALARQALALADELLRQNDR